MCANVAVTRAAAKLMQAITTKPSGIKFRLMFFLNVKTMIADAIESTQMRESSTILKSTSRKKSMTKNADIPKSVMNVTSLSKSKLEGCTNRM